MKKLIIPFLLLLSNFLYSDVGLSLSYIENSVGNPCTAGHAIYEIQINPLSRKVNSFEIGVGGGLVYRTSFTISTLLYGQYNFNKIGLSFGAGVEYNKYTYAIAHINKTITKKFSARVGGRAGQPNALILSALYNF